MAKKKQAKQTVSRIVQVETERQETRETRLGHGDASIRIDDARLLPRYRGRRHPPLRN